MELELSATEENLIEHVVSGGVLDLAPETDREDIDEATMQSWGDEHYIRASVIRDILRGLRLQGSNPDPRGLRIRAARIMGSLDLHGLASSIALSFTSCHVPDGIAGERCDIPNMVLDRCVIGGIAADPRRECINLEGASVRGVLSMTDAILVSEGGPAFAGDGLNVGNNVYLDGRFMATGHGPAGSVRLLGAHVAGQLVMSGASLANDAGPALIADDLTVDNGAFLEDGFNAVGHGEGGAVRMLGAHICGQLDMSGASLTNDAGPALSADGLRVDGDAFLGGGFTAVGDGKGGTVRMLSARVGGQLLMSRASLTNEAGPALIADRVIVDDNAYFDNEFVAIGHGPDAAVRLAGAHIGGQLGMNAATLNNRAGSALNADGMIVDAGAFFHRGFTATGHGPDAAVRLAGAHIGGQLGMSGATLTNDAGPALNASRLIADRGAFFLDNFTATGHGADAAVRLSAAQIGGQLRMSGATLINNAGPALGADGLSVDSDVAFDAGFNATGYGELGALRLLGARVGGQLGMTGASLTNNAGPALSADDLAIISNAFLNDEFTAIGHGANGAIRMPGTRIGGQLSMSGASVTNGSGPALIADGLIVDSDAALNAGFAATGSGGRGTLRMPDAHVGGQLSMRGASLTNDSGPALIANRLTVDSDAFFDGGFSASGNGTAGAMRLRGVHIGGRLAVSPGDHRKPRPSSTWAIDGLRYDGYPTVGFDEWLSFLRTGTTSYSPQPYQHLASVARAAGHDNEARKALITQRKDQIKRGNLSRGAKAWARFTGFTLGYGYQPWKALIFVIITVAISFINVFYLNPHGFTRTSGPKICTATERSQIAIDVVIPFVRTSIGTLCHTTSTDSGQQAAAINIGLTLTGWAFTALFAAGFTRAIRQP